MAWLIANYPGVLGVVSAVLSAGVLLMHLLHKDSVADKLQVIEDKVNGLLPPK